MSNQYPGIFNQRYGQTSSGGGYMTLSLTFAAGSTAQVFPIGMTRISVASTTTIYLVGRAAFGVSTLTGYGYIGARRVR